MDARPLHTIRDVYPIKKLVTCVIYIRKNLNFNPRETKTYGDSLKVTSTLNKEAVDFYNIYSPGRASLIPKIIHLLKPNPNCYIAGGFNSHTTGRTETRHQSTQDKSDATQHTPTT